MPLDRFISAGKRMRNSLTNRQPDASSAAELPATSGNATTPPPATAPAAAPAPTAVPAADERPPDHIPESLAEPWASSLRLAFDQMKSADELYFPTSFWQPGVRALLSDLDTRGIETFKSWPSSAYFFYPKYSPVLSYAQVDEVMPTLLAAAPRAGRAFFFNRLVGAKDVDRDVDVALALLDTEKLPLDLERSGESNVGKLPQAYRPFGADGPTFGRPFLNYALIMAALSRHLDRPIKSAIEIGAGFGVLGELLMHADPTVQYVDLDIPPLSVIAHYYLSTVFPKAKFLSNLDLASRGTLELGEGQPSACLSSWHLPQLTGTTDLFVNSFSFQEMEPHVVQNYAAQVARLGARYVVSLNSRAGKPLAANSKVGVEQQVKSDFIRKTFEKLGYTTLLRGGRPMAPPQAELLILKLK